MTVTVIRMNDIVIVNRILLTRIVSSITLYKAFSSVLTLRFKVILPLSSSYSPLALLLRYSFGETPTFLRKEKVEIIRIGIAHFLRDFQRFHVRRTQ